MSVWHTIPNITSNGSFNSGVIQTNGSFSPSIQAVKITFCILVAIVSILGNLLVILAVYRVPRMRTTTFYFIVNMSISDILFTVISMPPFVLGIAGYGLLFGGDLGLFICKFVNSTTFGLMASTVLTMTAIAFDRYFAITKPMRDIINKAVLQRVIIAIWLASLLTSSPLIYSFRIGKDESGHYCYESWSPLFDEITGTRIYTLLGFTIIYMIPFTTIAVLYSLVARHLWFGTIPRSLAQTQNNLLNSRRKVVTMLITVLILFIICWLPIQIMTFLTYFSDFEGNGEVLFMGEFLLRTNAAINPVLYMIFSSTFRQALRAAFGRPATQNPVPNAIKNGENSQRASISMGYFRKMSIYHYNDIFSNLKRETSL